MGIKERAIYLLIAIIASIAILSVILIFVFVAKEALPVLFNPEIKKEANLKVFFFTKDWQPVGEYPKYSFLPLIVGTLKVTLVALMVALPLSLGAALFTAEFLPREIREFIKPIIELFSAIPSVVLGFFALMNIASWVQTVFHSVSRLNAVTAGFALAFAVIPITYTICEDALNAVPRELREASLALGATKWQTAVKVVLPAASGGIFAGVMLGLTRAIGETMIVLMVSGNAAQITLSLLDSVRTIPATIAAEMGEVAFGSAHYATLFFLGLLLFSVTFIINYTASILIERTQVRLRGGK
ncbi:MAG: phosphate ABC transporter permease subunit PstC [bacterium]